MLHLEKCVLHYNKTVCFFLVSIMILAIVFIEQCAVLIKHYYSFHGTSKFDVVIFLHVSMRGQRGFWIGAMALHFHITF